jgi:hypothetical protein
MAASSYAVSHFGVLSGKQKQQIATDFATLNLLSPKLENLFGMQVTRRHPQRDSQQEQRDLLKGTRRRKGTWKRVQYQVSDGLAALKKHQRDALT